MSDESIEQRLFEAYQGGRGIRLSADELWQLIRDDAVATRISNRACIEVGVDEIGHDMIRVGETWSKFKKRIQDS